MKSIALRVDVDTYKGTLEGVPILLDILEKNEVQASFFFSLGPDNMGRHLWRLIKPGFFLKMLKSRASKLYGWDILLAGTAWPGKRIGANLATIIQAVAKRGHEVGLHAWDHYAWQTYIDKWSREKIAQQFAQGLTALENILKTKVRCSAAPGWRANQKVIEAQERFNLLFSSDCRGYSVFLPQLGDGTLGVPQIPVDLPTFDEVAQRELTINAFNRHIMTQMRQASLGVYTIHAEVEGGYYARGFDELLRSCKDNAIFFSPLSKKLPQDLSQLPKGSLYSQRIAGREGWVACQGEPL